MIFLDIAKKNLDKVQNVSFDLNVMGLLYSKTCKIFIDKKIKNSGRKRQIIQLGGRMVKARLWFGLTRRVISLLLLFKTLVTLITISWLAGTETF